MSYLFSIDVNKSDILKMLFIDSRIFLGQNQKSQTIFFLEKYL